ncbi:periplasmic or secreted protein [Pandoraea terrae]|uniref:Periplasmic or secreted protein n=1 Tax=Pandoraea terrae TaxID=1537710 RepID=A0A5E4RKC5_9BURK|nr:SIMPL domain-containing protein [Pandoraea terrae]VVD62469.1 periplasmic or secreted protein [Pandoraea terrae]
MKLKSAAAALLLAAAGAAHAQAGEFHAPVAGVLSLDAQATADVPQDTVHITMFAEQQGSDPAAISAALNRKAADAVKIAKAQTDVDVQTGNVSLYPTSDRDGRISAWRGRTELLLKSKDFPAASRLASQLSGQMQIGGVSFSLSREAQRATQAKLTEQAIASFREQAQSNARAFGYGGYTIRQVQVGQNAPIMPRQYMVMSAMADKAAAPAMPLEGGKAQVTVTVSGSVQMTR